MAGGRPARRATTSAKIAIRPRHDPKAGRGAPLCVAVFRDRAAAAVFRAPAGFPGGRAGDVLTVAFAGCRSPCRGPNGGSAFRQTMAFPFPIAPGDRD